MSIVQTRIGLFSIKSPCLVNPQSADQSANTRYINLGAGGPIESANKAKRMPLPASAPCIVFQRRKLPVSIQLRLRKPSPRADLGPDAVHVVVRITVNGVRDGGFLARERQINADKRVSFGETLVIDSRKWSRVGRHLGGHGAETVKLNDTLTAIKYTIKEIHARQIKRNGSGKAPRPTVDSVKYEYLTGLRPEAVDSTFVYPESFLWRKGKNAERQAISAGSALLRPGVLGPLSPIIEVTSAYLAHIDTNKKAPGLVSKSYYEHRKHAYDYLDRFTTKTVTISELTPYFLEGFHSFLLTQSKGNAHHKKKGKKLNPGTATLYCRFVNEALVWLKKQRLIKKNPFGSLYELDLPGYKTKEVYCLESSHLKRLFDLKPPTEIQPAHWWFRLICLTGLDYSDAIRYAQARNQYETITPGGHPKLVIRRSKPPQNECNIPIRVELFALWDEVNGEAPTPIRYTTLLLHLKKIARLIDFSRQLTPKIGRKTAGTLFLDDHSIHGVSNILGHSSIHVTELHYVKVRGYHVDNEMDKKAEKQIQSRSANPFTQIHKSA